LLEKVVAISYHQWLSYLNGIIIIDTDSSLLITISAPKRFLELLCGTQAALLSGTTVPFGHSYCIQLNVP